MPRELFQSPNLARSFTQLSSPSLTIRKRRNRADLSPPPWCRLTPAIVRQGLGSTAYEHCIDLYCIEELEVSDTNRRIMTFWKSSSCNLCKDIFPRYTVCRHIARITDIDAANRGGFLVSCSRFCAFYSSHDPCLALTMRVLG